jgi:DNA-binding transcriptional MocR family regulator
MDRGDFLYEQLAAELGQAIERGILRPGERLPSVRRLAEDRAISIATVVQAYVLLENDGLVEVRPKSGHFVRRRSEGVAEPRPPRCSPQPTRVSVSVSDAVARLLAAMRDPSIIPLGSAHLLDQVLPVAAVNRIMSTLARESRGAGARYDVPPGLITLRRQLARRSIKWGLALDEDDFVTTIGATEGLMLGLRAIAKPGDAVAVESPAYFGVLQAIEGLGMRAVEVPANPRTGIDLDELDAVLKAGGVRGVVVSPNVSNPLGAVMPDDAKLRLVRLAVRHDVPVIEDDVYGDLVFDGTRPRPLRAFDHDGRVLLVGSVSKTIAPGYRVGWIAPGRYAETVERLKFSSTLANPTLTQMAIAEFLASGGYDRHLRRLRALLSGHVDKYRDAIAAAFPDGTRVSAPRGGFVLWVELPSGCDALAIQARALDHGIAIAPGPMFSPRNRFTNFLRISCGSPMAPRIEGAIRTLGEIAADDAAGGDRRRRARASA